MADEHLRDAHSAVETLARRADGLTDFVSSYRQLLSLPEPALSRFRISDLLGDVERMATSDQAQTIASRIHVSAIHPPSLALNADRTLLEQVLLNLINNAVQAITGSDSQNSGRISLSTGMNNRGQIFIEVTDDGPGIPEEVAERMFVPFLHHAQRGNRRWPGAQPADHERPWRQHQLQPANLQAAPDLRWCSAPEQRPMPIS